MKPKILYVLLGFSILWASVVSFLYIRLKNNPRVIAVTTGLNSSMATDNLQLGELEKVTYLRQYLDRYFNYDSNNFWQTQTSLSFLMAPELRGLRIEEVRRLREKIQQKNLTQKSQLLSLASQAPGQFIAQLAVQITEGQHQTSKLNITLNLELESTERTLENPWGLLVKQMKFLKSNPDEVPFSSLLKIQRNMPLTITLPCAIENIESSSEEEIKTKITTLNISEVQLTTDVALSSPVQMKALCRDSEFDFQVAGSNQEADLFKAFPQSQGRQRKKELPPSNPRYAKPRSKDIYEKTIENVLGIKLEN